MLDRHIGETNVFFQPWRVHATRDVAYFLAGRHNLPKLAISLRKRVPMDLDTRKISFHALCPDLLERLPANEIAGLLQIDEPVHTEDERIIGARYIGRVGQQATFNAANRRRRNWRNVEFLACFNDPLP